jgi:ribosomal protein L11 methyltransferase
MASDFILEISFDADDRSLQELIDSKLYLTPCTGSTSREVNGTATVDAYFDTPEERDAAAAEFAELPANTVELHVTERERVDWLEHYQQSLEPIVIGERFIVAPDAALIDASDSRMRIVVPQEQAFGTGSHETTALCIELLEGMELHGKRGLDVGSGSGILAIAMHRLGALRAIAFDNDPDAYGALRDNRMRNEVPDAAMPLFIGSVEALRAGTFDVVTMNIIPEVIIPLLGDVVPRLADGATLILSGILNVRREDVLAAAAPFGLKLRREKSRGEWWAGELTS